MIDYTPFIFKKIESVSGEVKASSPSNIALIKYWGKTEGQIPANPSVSYTLDQCRTSTTLCFSHREKKKTEIELTVFFEGEKNEPFRQKILNFFSKIAVYCPYLFSFTFRIFTQNTFPHSSGIASSASGMSALAFCLVEMERKMGAEYSEEERLKRASFLARLGSGSASRSVYPGLVLWGKHPKIPYSSNLIAQPIATDIHPVFKTFHDTILVVHKGQKAVSSTRGHALMRHHPYAKKRFEQAFDNIIKLQALLKSGGLEAFGELIESEALSLHAMMMTSTPYFILMRPKTLEIIQQVQQFRSKNNLALFFTLDAGANVHLLYPEKEKNKIRNFIEKELRSYCEDSLYIHDTCCTNEKKCMK